MGKHTTARNAFFWRLNTFPFAAKVEREKLIVAALPSFSAEIVEHSRQHGRATMSEIIRQTEASRITSKKHLAQLVRNTISLGTERGRKSVCAALILRVRPAVKC